MLKVASYLPPNMSLTHTYLALPPPAHLPQVLEEVTVTFRGANCEEAVWPLLHPGERPVVLVSQDESTFHANDDVSGEWMENGKGMRIKKKSRGGFIIVSMFISELRGKLRCTTSE